MGRCIGEKIILREFRAEDISGMRQWITDDAITGNLSGIFLKPHTWEQTEQYLNGLLSGDAGGVNFVIAEKASMKYLGQCNLLMIDHTARKAELAIVIGREHHGQGYGKEAIRLLLGFAFAQLNLHRVYLKVYADNHRAVALYARCGFVEEGRLREDSYRNGRYTDVIEMGILRSEFEALKATENA